MRYPIYQVDAFASELFAGNPAAVMPLEEWLDDALLQSIAMENNLSETAFIVPREGAYELRWFTPAVEVELCGHATLAAAHVLFRHLGCADESIVFHTQSGELTVEKGEQGLTLNFPARELAAAQVDVVICDALGAVASEAMATTGGSGPLLLVYEFEQDVARLRPDFSALKRVSDVGVIVSAPGDDCDFVSRFFAPHVGIDEDPVTGSAHCNLVPYWAGRLQKNALRCRQISARGGDLSCELRDNRVYMSESAVTFMEGAVSL